MVPSVLNNYNLKNFLIICLLYTHLLREIALKANTIRFISIVLVQQQLLKWELFY